MADNEDKSAAEPTEPFMSEESRQQQSDREVKAMLDALHHLGKIQKAKEAEQSDKPKESER